MTHRAWSSKVLECRVDLWRLLWWLQTIHWVFPKSKHLNDITTKLNKYASCWEVVVPKEFIHGKILHVYIAQWINEWMDVAGWMAIYLVYVLIQFSKGTRTFQIIRVEFLWLICLLYPMEIVRNAFHFHWPMKQRLMPVLWKLEFYKFLWYFVSKFGFPNICLWILYTNNHLHWKR